MIVQQARQDRTEKKTIIAREKSVKKKVFRIRNRRRNVFFILEVGEFECLEIVIHCLL